MVTATPAPQGHCSRCGKVWTLKERQGVCQWCNKPAGCQSATSKPRHIKSSRRRKQRQVDGNGNGYDQLEGDWLIYYKVASRFTHKAKLEDREDLLHDIMIALADVTRSNGHKPFTEAVMYRVASVTVYHYWYRHYKATKGLDCAHCSTAQRHKCKESDLYRECPKAIKLESLSKPVVDSEGNVTELGELIADDKAIDLDQWLDINTFLAGCPSRLIGIAEKRLDGQALNNKDHQYLWYWRKREQKSLILS